MLDFIENLYRARFTRKELSEKMLVWAVLTKHFFQKYVKKTDTVLDVGAGYCEFINNIRAGRKIALDLNNDIHHFAAKDVEVVIAKCTDMKGVKDSSIDVVFISNILEHLKGAEEVEMTLLESRRVLRPGGKIIILQPNIKYAYREYWDFFDHVVPLSHLGTVEALRKTDFDVIEVRPRFLPYSSKSAMPKWPALIRLYLWLKPAHSIFGKQMLVIGKKRGDGHGKVNIMRRAR